ncbi:MAG TPA: pyridoxal phosphate-dependent aminotransferase [Candidatus Omnitrophica bacterium]|nr:pyridoxal phosphate-dependent aminotransferase [Candidatus Omnitrophota bacterium]
MLGYPVIRLSVTVGYPDTRLSGFPSPGFPDLRIPDLIMFSNRTNWPLSSNRIAGALDQLKKANVPIIDLTESNPTCCGFAYPSERILRPLASDKNLRYDPQPQGSLEARAAVASYYKSQGHDVSVERIFLTASTSEAYSYLFRLLVDAGQEVLFPRPSYPLFQFLGDLNDVMLNFYPLVYTNHWAIDCSQLEASIQPGTKAIVLVNPNNPTGSFIKKDELSALNRICRTKNIPIISDEVFADFGFPGVKDTVSLVNNDAVLTFVLGGVSKTLALPQMKLSWIIVSGPEELANAACQRLEMIADTYLSVNTPVQNAVAGWLSSKEEFQESVKQRTLDNLRFLEQAVKTTKCQLLKPEGGWYAVIRIPLHKISEEEFILQLLEEKHVFVHPGYFFDFEEEDFLVVSLLSAVDDFREGIKRLAQKLALL